MNYFSGRIFTLPKDPQHPGEFQDAARLQPSGGVAAVADGVSSAIFSALWAELLVDAVSAAPPDPDDPAAFAAWLKGLREQWRAKIDVSGLAWFQRAKLPTGAFATLLWVQLSASDVPDEYRLLCRAVGDTCLFHVRGGQLLGQFPIQQAAEFAADPIVLGSVDLNRDHLVAFGKFEQLCRKDDLLVLCTDAVAEWILRQIEAHDPPVWDDFAKMTDAEWHDGLAQLRSQGHMRYDDATLVVLRVGAAVDALPPPLLPVPPSEADAVVVLDETPLPVEPVVVGEPLSADQQPAAPVLLSDDDWPAKIKAASEKVAGEVDKVSDQLVRGMKTLFDRAARFYRENIKSDKK